MVKYVRCVELKGRKPHPGFHIGKVYELKYPLELFQLKLFIEKGVLLYVKTGDGRVRTAFGNRFIPVGMALDEKTIVI